MLKNLKIYIGKQLDMFSVTRIGGIKLTREINFR